MESRAKGVWMIEATAAVFGYLLGSVPFGLLLSRMAGLGDIRAIGSGNIGATNVLRTGRKDIAALTLLLDGGKGTLAVMMAAYYGGATAGLIAGVAAVLGHCTCIWLGGRGGKGVATGIGTVLGISWPAGLIACAAWLGVAWFTRFSSLAALVALGVAVLLVFVLLGTVPAVAAFAIYLIVVARHSENIKRLQAGTEPRIGERR